MIEIIVTKDGSHTLHHAGLNENYHSIHGALQESTHVFIKNGLDFILRRDQKEISILEVGFGTGLNALLTVEKILPLPVQVHYTTLEPFPLDQAIWSNLNYTTQENFELFQRLHHSKWSRPEKILPHFSLQKIKSTLQEIDFPESNFDLVYFDAFAPEKQPEMWRHAVLKKVAQWMKPDAILVTYCAKGQVKRDMKAVELMVESLSGPPGKREMIRASKP